MNSQKCDVEKALKEFKSFEITTSRKNYLSGIATCQDGLTYFVKFFEVSDDSFGVVDDQVKDLKKNINKRKLNAAETEIKEITENDGFILMSKRLFYPKTLSDFIKSLDDKFPSNESEEQKITDLYKVLLNNFKRLEALRLYHLNIKPENIAYDEKNKEIIFLDWESFICKCKISGDGKSADDKGFESIPKAQSEDFFNLGLIFLKIMTNCKGKDLFIECLYFKESEKYHTRILNAMEQNIAPIFSKLINTKLVLNLLSFDSGSRESLITILDSLEKKLCHGFCQNNEESHQNSYIHRVCRDRGMCKFYHNYNHRHDLKHPTMCKEGANCQKYNEIGNTEAEEHRLDFLHPPVYCIYKGQCTWFDPQHVKMYIHPPICEKLSDCDDISKNHDLMYTHKSVLCSQPFTCVLGKDMKRHLRDFKHSFLPVCENLYINKCDKKNDKVHQEQYSHACENGVFCILLDPKDPDCSKHCKRFIHIKKKMCPDNLKCSNLKNHDHIEEYAHSNILQIRDDCKDGALCYDTSETHLAKYSHPSKKKLIISNLYGKNENIDFYQNAAYLESMLDKYMSTHKLQLHDPIIEYCRNLRPQHRCNLEIFELVINHGVLLSKATQDNLLNNKHEEIKNQVLGDKQYIMLANQIGAASRNLNEIVEEMIKIQISILEKKEKEEAKTEKSQILLNSQPELHKKLEDIVRTRCKAICDHQTKGIGYHVDVKLNTHEHVFAVVGNNTGTKYGDIILVLKQEIMFHPDFNMTSTAGTSFYSKRTYDYRPWALEGRAKDSFKEEELINNFHRSKLNAYVKKWEMILAKELTCKAHNLYRLIGKNYNVNDPHLPLEYEKLVDSHFLFEAHLPPKVPLSMIEKIIINKTSYDLLMKSPSYSLLKDYMADSWERVMVILDKTTSDPLKDLVDMKLGIYQEINPLKGLSFSIIDQKGKDTAGILPVIAQNSNNFRVSFEMLEKDFHLRISAKSQKCFDCKSDDYIYFVFGFKHSFNFEDVKKNLWDENFIMSIVQHKNEKDKVQFVLTHSEKKIYEKIEGAGHNASRFYIKCILEIEDLNVNGATIQQVSFGIDMETINKGKTELHKYKMPKRIEGLKYFTASCWEKPVYIRNFEVLNN